MSNKNEKDSIISSFKKFSELSSKEKKSRMNEEPDLTELPFDDGDLPANPNVPQKTGRFESPMSTKHMMPSGQKVNPDQELNEGKVEFYGKVAKLPKGTKASKGYNFLENVKISKSSIWYIMVEKQDNELQMVKYNHKKGVDLAKFVEDLKGYYTKKFEKNPKIQKMIESIAIDGNDKYSWVKNIPLIEIDGRKMISKITEDLIRLLSK
jgi:hypothetical protein